MTFLIYTISHLVSVNCFAFSSKFWPLCSLPSISQVAGKLKLIFFLDLMKKLCFRLHSKSGERLGFSFKTKKNDRLTFCRLTSRLLINKQSPDKMPFDKMTVDKMTVDKMTVDKMTVDI